MTDDSDHSTQPDSEVADVGRTGASPTTRADWETLPIDPDNERDLGYRLTEWERFGALADDNHITFLPEDEPDPADAAFVVAAAESVVPLDTRR